MERRRVASEQWKPNHEGLLMPVFTAGSATQPLVLPKNLTAGQAMHIQLLAQEKASARLSMPGESECACRVENHGLEPGSEPLSPATSPQERREREELSKILRDIEAQGMTDASLESYLRDKGIPVAKTSEIPRDKRSADATLSRLLMDTAPGRG